MMNLPHVQMNSKMSGRFKENLIMLVVIIAIALLVFVYS
jgi:hypothetical protein